MDEDAEAAIEWQQYHDSLCVGCGNPRSESFDPANDDRYDVTVLACHACAARDRKAHVLAKNRDDDAPPPAGLFLAITGPTDDE